MTKEGEGIIGATRSSQDLTKKSAKSASTLDEDWEGMDLQAASAI